MCVAAMDPGYQFSADPSYVQPPVGTHSEYIECFKGWYTLHYPTLPYPTLPHPTLNPKPQTLNHKP